MGREVRYTEMVIKKVGMVMVTAIMLTGLVGIVKPGHQHFDEQVNIVKPGHQF